MDLSNKILSKSEINSRAVDALLAIIANGLVATKTDLADCLGATPQKFSEILKYRMKVGIDMIAKICDNFHVNPDWLLMGRGCKIFRDNANMEPYFIDDANFPQLDRKCRTFDNPTVNEEAQTESAPSILMAENKLLREQISNKEITIREQDKEIGRLEERIKQLQQRLEKTVGAVNTGDTANVG